MLPADWQIKNYDQVGNLPLTWRVTAEDLLIAADILKAHRASYKPFDERAGGSVPNEGRILFPELMLRGQAMECRLKALWLGAGNELAVSGKYVGVPNAGDHDLVQLADAVKVTLNAAQRDCLKRLSIIIVSIARYPIPRNWADTRIQKAYGGGSGPPTYWTGADDVLFEELLAATV